MTVTPKGDKPLNVQLNDFQIFCEADGDRTQPQSGDEIAATDALVLKRGQSGIGSLGEQTGTTWSGVGFGGRSSKKKKDGDAEDSATMKKGTKDEGLKDVLNEKVLPEKGNQGTRLRSPVFPDRKEEAEGPGHVLLDPHRKAPPLLQVTKRFRPPVTSPFRPAVHQNKPLPGPPPPARRTPDGKSESGGGTHVFLCGAPGPAGQARRSQAATYPTKIGFVFSAPLANQSTHEREPNPKNRHMRHRPWALPPGFGRGEASHGHQLSVFQLANQSDAPRARANPKNRHLRHRPWVAFKPPQCSEANTPSESGSFFSMPPSPLAHWLLRK